MTIREVDAADIIIWLNQHLALYAREQNELRRQLDEALRKNAMLIRLMNDLDRQRREGKCTS